MPLLKYKLCEVEIENFRENESSSFFIRSENEDRKNKDRCLSELKISLESC